MIEPLFLADNARNSKKTLILIVTYNATRYIREVLSRIPTSIYQDPTIEIAIFDDASRDDTCAIARQAIRELGLDITIVAHEKNRGYGGNQQNGYRYAIDHGFNAVILLHGDAQYAPEQLPELLAPILAGTADVVLGSRMITPQSALNGGMPWYKFIGNKCLTKLQNLLLGTTISEFHTGYRAYSTALLKRVPFEYNGRGFIFDTEILIQAHDQKARIKEIATVACYNGSVCHVPLMRYTFAALWATLLSRLQKKNLYYTPRFDYGSG